MFSLRKGEKLYLYFLLPKWKSNWKSLAKLNAKLKVIIANPQLGDWKDSNGIKKYMKKKVKVE